MTHAKIATRLWTIVGAGLAVATVIALLGVWSQVTLWDGNERLHSLEAANAKLYHLDTRESELKADAYRALIETDIAAVAKEGREDVATVEKVVAELDGFDVPPILRTHIAAVRSDVTEFSQFVTDFVAAAQRDRPAAALRMGEIADRNHAVDDKLSALHERFDAEITTARNDARSSSMMIRWLGAIVLIVSIVAFVVMGRSVARSIVVPFARVRQVLESLAGGDLTARAELRSADEMGQVASSLDTAVATMQDSVGGVAGSAESVATAARQFADINADISEAAAVTASRTRQASDAARRVSENVTTVAASAEQMMSSIQEISRSATSAAAVVTDAVQEASQANDKVERLAGSSAEIGDVVALITSITGQTKLLALNATIEAARAGDAGRGFAVVADEVKELAQATAKATNDIKDRIMAIQSDTGSAAAAIRHVVSVISEINDLQTTIVGAVEEQTATTREITRNISEVAHDSHDIARGVAEAADATVHATAGVARARDAASGLTEMSDQLRVLVGRFSF